MSRAGMARNARGAPAGLHGSGVFLHVFAPAELGLRVRLEGGMR